MLARRLRVEADGGSRGNPGPAAYGAVVRDGDTGELLAEIADTIGAATNNVAEYRGLLAGLTAARDIDPRADVEVRLDSKLIVEQMSGRWRIKHPDLRPLAAAAAAVFPRDRVRYRWVPRAQNAHADRLLNEALDAAVHGRPLHRRTTVAPAAGEPVRQRLPDGDVRQPATAYRTGWSGAQGTATGFVLLRHGATDLTVEKRFSGSGGDPALSARGRIQAEHAAEALADHGGIDVVISSPLRRARETADRVAQRLRPGVEVEVDDGFREVAFGAWEGLTFAEIQERWPAELGDWLASPAVAPPGGGESFEAAEARIRAAHQRVLDRYAGRTVLVVTHVTPIKTLVRLALQAPPAAMYRMELDAASLSVVHWFADGPAVLRVFNDTAHLR